MHRKTPTENNPSINIWRQKSLVSTDKIPHKKNTLLKSFSCKHKNKFADDTIIFSGSFVFYFPKYVYLDLARNHTDGFFLLLVWKTKISLKPGSDGSQESLSRCDVHSFSLLVAATRGENEWISRRDKLSCLPSKPDFKQLLSNSVFNHIWNIFRPLKTFSGYPVDKMTELL